MQKYRDDSLPDVEKVVSFNKIEMTHSQTSKELPESLLNTVESNSVRRLVLGELGESPRDRTR